MSRANGDPLKIPQQREVLFNLEGLRDGANKCV